MSDQPRHPDAPHGIRLLVVDDSAMMRSMVARGAQSSGLPIGTIHEAGDGQQALAVLDAHEVDALFTDINMPVMGGIELLQRLAADDRWRRLLRVIISTDGSEARRAQADALDVRFYVGKPFRPEAIRDVLASLVDCRSTEEGGA